MLDLFGTPAGRALNNKQNILSKSKALEIMENQKNLNYLHQMKIPQSDNSSGDQKSSNQSQNSTDSCSSSNTNTNTKLTINNKTQKSLCKINLFIKRLKIFNLFNDSPSSKKTSKDGDVEACSQQTQKSCQQKW